MEVFREKFFSCKLQGSNRALTNNGVLFLDDTLHNSLNCDNSWYSQIKQTQLFTLFNNSQRDDFVIWRKNMIYRIFHNTCIIVKYQEKQNDNNIYCLLNFYVNKQTTIKYVKKLRRLAPKVQVMSIIQTPFRY